MSFRNLFITQRSHISVDRNNVQIIQDDKFVRVPAEDLLSVVVEDRRSTITAYALSFLAQNNVAVYFCDHTHTPNSVHLPFAARTRQLRKSELQWRFSIPNQKNVWKRIVTQKILNQAAALKLCGAQETARKLLPIAAEVKSGDSTNREGYAAMLYFKAMFGKDFIRTQDSSINNFLNYGYAILRGILARSISACGLNPEKGVFHKNEFNNFNLADDFIEPYRPLVDAYVKKLLLHYNTRILSPEIKGKLYDLVNYLVRVKDKNYSVATSAEQVIQSYARCVEAGTHSYLVLPQIESITRSTYE